MASPLDITLLHALAAEADAAAAGLEVRALVDAAGGGHLLLLAEPGGERICLRLLIVTESPRARLHLVPPRKPPKPPPVETAFTRDAAPHLRGAGVRSVAAIAGDRIVEVHLSGPGDSGPKRLVAQLFGRAPNLLLVDGSGSIRALKRKKGQRIAVGRPYQAPEVADRPADAPSSIVPASSTDEFADHHPLAAAVDEQFHPLDLESRRSELFRAVTSALGRIRKKNARLCERLEEEIRLAAGAEQIRQQGDILSAHFAELRPGLESLEADDLYGDGRVTIRLDPALEPRQNIDKYYRRARKLERTRTGAGQRLEQVGRASRALADLAADLEAASESGAWIEEELAARLLEAGVVLPSVVRPSPAAATRQKAVKLAGIRRFVLRSGFEILVGKTNRDNDYLTVRVARGNDTWLHLHGEAGSHVVIRQQKGRTPSLDDLLDAAALAVHFSRRRGASNAEVIYTQRKYVRKSRGLKPGAVTVDRHKTLYLSDAAERAKAVLTGTRGDDGP